MSDDFIIIFKNLVSTNLDFSMPWENIKPILDAVGVPLTLGSHLYEEILIAATKYDIALLKDYLVQFVSKYVTI